MFVALNFGATSTETAKHTGFRRFQPSGCTGDSGLALTRSAHGTATQTISEHSSRNVTTSKRSRCARGERAPVFAVFEALPSPGSIGAHWPLSLNDLAGNLARRTALEAERSKRAYRALGSANVDGQLNNLILWTPHREARAPSERNVGQEDTMGCSGRAPAPDGTRGERELCQEDETNNHTHQRRAARSLRAVDRDRCKRGHDLESNAEVVWTTRDGKRTRCRACKVQDDAAYRARLRRGIKLRHTTHRRGPRPSRETLVALLLIYRPNTVASWAGVSLRRVRAISRGAR